MSRFSEERGSHSDETTNPYTESFSVHDNEVNEINDDPVVIIGFSFKFPEEADTSEGLWNMLLEKRCASSEFPADRMNVNGHYRKGKKNNTVCQMYPFVVVC